MDRSWWSWAGAHGGYLAALGLTVMRTRLAAQLGGQLGGQLGEDANADADQDQDQGEDRAVRSLTTHFLAPVDDRPLTLSATVERAGRGTCVASFTGEQGGAAALLGSAVFGAPRPGGPSHDGDDSRAPAVPGADDCEALELPLRLAEFARHLEIRPATTARPLAGGDRAELVAWVRFADGRPLDAEAVVVLADTLPPALFARWTTPRPVPSAELTVHFGDALDHGPVGGWALVRIRTEHAGSGWAVDDSAVWAADGRLLGLGRQARRILPEPA
ncbi:thioesterase family protein [Streptomyces sp. H10-C2]|uniref:acyl-CoA thioesterase n=1 Tax=unclassified Streptomyces TaxID=2593676 RepID=UPI0024B9671A|nr:MULTISPECIES: thioesterase family protein [unclassified Streptomyces]MDJ0342135.1 thioesterase family protein [Streptomyces sp. PH10-H1]MDJ0368477.1 thioesterase family protein [Streptomyces sp. H10-C2]